MVVATIMANNGFPPGLPPSLPPLNPSIPPDYIENGRLYHGYRKGTYMYPCDEEEKDRMDIYHKFFQVARSDMLHSAPFTPNYDGPRILDLGCGTGIWAIDMADKYPQAEVLGMDISLIQPNVIPENLLFRRRDIEAPWHGMALESWDLIHMRMLAGSISSWPEMYQKIFRHLKPGFGWLEHVEIDFQPHCENGSLPPDAPVFRWFQYLAEAHERAFKPLTYNVHTGAMLRNAGFVDVHEKVLEIPLSAWHPDRHQRDVGRWFSMSLVYGLEAMSLGPLSRMFGWNKEDIARLIAETKANMIPVQNHLYCHLHIWTARRPQ